MEYAGFFSRLLVLGSGESALASKSPSRILVHRPHSQLTLHISIEDDL